MLHTLRKFQGHIITALLHELFTNLLLASISVYIFAEIVLCDWLAKPENVSLDLQIKQAVFKCCCGV